MVNNNRDKEDTELAECLQRLILRLKATSGSTVVDTLAIKVEVSPKAIRNWLRGNHSIRVSNLVRLIEVFCELKVFVKGQEEKEAQELWQAAKNAYNRNYYKKEMDFPKALDQKWFRSIMEKYNPPEYPEPLIVLKGVETSRRDSSITVGPIFNVPHLRNPNFTGRQELLDQLQESLKTGKYTTITQSLVGLGGIGKTQLAIEYTFRQRHHYRVIWWLRAEESATLAGDYATLGYRLGLTGIATPHKEAIKEVKYWLTNHTGWLLIFDNAANPQSLKDYLVSGGNIIITSRHPNWAKIAQNVEVLPMSISEATLFLERRTTLKEPEAAEQLAQELGGLPLALEQASAYIERTGCSISEYLKLFRERHLYLDSDSPLELGYEATVVTTWQLNFERVEAANPASADLVQLLAYLGPEVLKRTTLQKGAETLPPLLRNGCTDSAALNETIGALRDYSLLTTPGDMLSTHRLVQLVTRQRLDSIKQAQWLSTAITFIEKVFPYDKYNTDTWDESAMLLPHLLTACEHGEQLGIELKTVGHLFNEAGQYLERRADYPGAIRLFEASIRVGKKSIGFDHHYVGLRINNLGEVFRILGDHAKAKACYEEALRLNEISLGPNHPDLAIIVNNLGLVSFELGNYEEAKKYYRRAIEIDSAEFGPKDPNVAIGLSNLGEVFEEEGEYEKAKEYYEQALQIDLAARGPHHHIVAIRKNNLGGILRIQGDYSAAENYLQEALIINKATFGPKHPEVATDLHGLGQILQDKGDWIKATYCYRQALEIDKMALGPIHANIARDLKSWGDLLVLEGDLADAKTKYEEASTMFEQSLGSNHPSTHRTNQSLEALKSLL